MLPAKLRPIVQWVVDRLPEPIADRVLPWRRAAFRSAGPAQVPEANRRLLIGPVNSAGQAHAWASAASAMDDTAAANVMFRNDDDPFAFPADQSVRTIYAVRNTRWQRAQRRAINRGFTHVLIESGRRMLGSGYDVKAEIADFERHGLKVGLLWHGSDIRRPGIHAEMDDDSPFRQGRYPQQDLLEEVTSRNQALLAETGLQSFVSTPDLLAFVPDATWLPVVIDVPKWTTAAVRQVLQEARPVVVHAPSRAGLKGTALIAPTLRRLHAEGLIDYREVKDLAAHEMPRVYGEADIILDQFSLGIYGVAVCEALASGRIVVSHISDQVRDTVLSVTGRELPVIESRAADLEAVLRDIVAEPDRARAIASRGPAFVADVHDGARSRAALASFLGR